MAAFMLPQESLALSARVDHMTLLLQQVDGAQTLTFSEDKGCGVKQREAVSFFSLPVPWVTCTAPCWHIGHVTQPRLSGETGISPPTKQVGGVGYQLSQMKV